jgi:DNA-binding NarL/FixJ family response regulator
MVQEATRAVLRSLPDVTLVATASGALSATQLLPHLQPDLLLMDANLPEEEVRALLYWTREHYPEVQCVVMTLTSREREWALAAGARAAIQRASLADQLEALLRQLPRPSVQDSTI